jgi:hypothetical protein
MLEIILLTMDLLFLDINLHDMILLAGSSVWFLCCVNCCKTVVVLIFLEPVEVFSLGSKKQVPQQLTQHRNHITALHIAWGASSLLKSYHSCSLFGCHDQSHRHT